MIALEKAKEALNKASGILDFHGHSTDYIDEAIAALEAEKKSDNELKTESQSFTNMLIRDFSEQPHDEPFRYVFSIKLEMFAKNHHATKCAECPEKNILSNTTIGDYNEESFRKSLIHMRSDGYPPNREYAIEMLKKLDEKKEQSK